MNLLDNLSNVSNYQFPPWPRSISRPNSCLPSNEFLNDTVKLSVDNRNQLPRPNSSSSTKRTVQHHIHIPTAFDSASSPSQKQPSTPSDLFTKSDRLSSRPMSSRRFRSIPVRIKSASLSIPISKTKEDLLSQNFPRQTHEQRKVTHERKQRRQQAQFLADKYAESETWFQLRRSLGELKRLATTQDILIDPSTSFFHCDGQSLTELKQVINEEEKKGTIFKSESFCSTYSTHDFNRPSLSTSRTSLTRSRSTKTYPRLVFEPLIIGSKPIHPVLFNDNHIPSPPKLKFKPPASPLYRSRPITTPLTDEKRAHLLLSDVSNEQNPPNSISQSPPMVKIDPEISSQKISTSTPTRFRAPSTFQLTSTVKLKPQIPRCRSATDIKSSSLNKHPLRFILICDQEHRIESWYNQYPFIHSDDLLASFQSKSSPPKLTISAFFIDDLQSSNPNITAKTFLQGKPFHINNDWRKYDVIFISNNIYEQIIIYLQTIINLIQSSGKIIQIYQINHEEDVKKQVKNICKQLQQQNF